MEQVLVYGVLVLLLIAATTTLSGRLGVAAPLLLVAVGIAVSLLPFTPDFRIEPEWILAGLLPPLLYAAAVQMPVMDFRREFNAIGGLSVVLVVVSSILLGLFFAWIIPGLGLGWGIALGAIVSPTDAVATSIIKGMGISPRVVTILQGESLLNDATALVLLRTAIAGTAAAVSLWGVVGSFAYSVIVALVIGYLVGKANLLVRSHVSDATVNTVLSFTVPFIASLPTEALGASGLVAAVVAGLVTGRGAARKLTPRHRISDAENWRMIELVLEGLVFLIMGLEIDSVIQDVQAEHAGVGVAASVAALALLLTLLVRAGFVAGLLRVMRARVRRTARMRPRIRRFSDHLEAASSSGPDTAASDTAGPDTAASDTAAPGGVTGWRLRAARRPRFQSRVRRTLFDIDYLQADPLGWRDGVTFVWAGMRGAVTVAAAQTLPSDTPNRSLLVFIAFLIAAGSLLIQGGTIPWVTRLVYRGVAAGPTGEEERTEMLALLKAAAESVPRPTDPASPPQRRRHRLAMISAQREALLDARDEGRFSSAALGAALNILDADQLSVELKGGPEPQPR